MKRWTWMGMAVLVLGLGMTGCDKASGGATDDYEGAVPDQAMLALSFDDAETAGGALKQDDATLPAFPYRATAQKVMDGLNALVADTHAALEQLKAAVAPVEVTKGAITCKTWAADGPKAHWSFTSCLKDKGAKKFGFVLLGRPLTSTSDDDYLVVMAGEGKAMPAWNGKKRGIGRVGYNFDNLASLTGESVGGRLGITYRAVGIVRALNLGLDEVVGPNATEAQSGLYRFRLLVGKGGRFSWVDHDDYLTRDGENALAAGEDGLAEWVRVAAGWRTDGAARTVRAACGGTVGENQCVRVAECWDAGQALTWQLLLDESAAIDWQPNECAIVPLGVDGEPDLDDLKPPKDKDEEAAAPMPDEPDSWTVPRG
jgi:hypothetical protein